MLREYAIDGCNVVFWRRKPSDPASLVPLFRIVNTIVARGESFYCVFDASIKGHLEKSGDARETEILDELISSYSEMFFRVTASTVADDVICKWADQRQCGVITNDLYRNLAGQYKWISPHSDRLIQGNLLSDGMMIIKKLPYEVVGNARLEDLYNDFKSSISQNFTNDKGSALAPRQEDSAIQSDYAAWRAEAGHLRSAIYRKGRWKPVSDRDYIAPSHNELLSVCPGSKRVPGVS